MNDINIENKSCVADFYNKKSIFITGGTGFLGKMYIRQVLYSCQGVNKIYMLMRARSKEEAKQRVEYMIDNSSQLFENLKEGDLAKLVPVIGDLTAPNLGIQTDEEHMLLEEVSIIVNSAATINLNETLRDAINTNVIGTQNLLNMAKRVKKLEAFLHISTLFCNLSSDKLFINEKVYPPPIALSEVCKIKETYGHMTLPPNNILRDKRNNYLFTKSLAESMVVAYHGDLPTAIIRPSLIGCSYTEPYRGWIDVINIHSVLMLAISKGLLRVLTFDINAIGDFIPVDYVANLMILAATKCKRSKAVDVYNCASSGINPISYSKALSFFKSKSTRNQSRVMSFPFLVYVKSKILVKLLSSVLESTPAHINDLMRLLNGKDPISVKYHRKLSQIVEDVKFIMEQPWRARADRVISLDNSLSDEDKRIFPSNPCDIDWSEYFNRYCEGITNYILNKKRKSKL